MDNPAVLVLVVVYIAVLIITIAGAWATFAKAGKPGWAVIIPIYNTIVLLEIAGKPIWWIILFFIPIVNLIIAIITLAAMCERFGRGGGTVVGLIFLPFIFWPILGFGSARYRGGDSGGRRRYEDVYEEDRPRRLR